MELSSSVLVTPIYRLDLDEFETFNVWLTGRSAPHFARTIACPADLAVDSFAQTFGFDHIERFEDRCFRSRQSYNALLLSAEFYARFKSYEYMIVSQMDAVLVADPSAALTWGFDFIGAPWIDEIDSRIGVFDLRGQRRWASAARALGLSHRARVGNGGLSLRRIARFEEICHKYDDFPGVGRAFVEEDLVFSYFGKTGALKIPSPDVAAEFSYEWGAFNLPELPDTFGFHALAKVNLPLYLALRERHLTEFRAFERRRLHRQP